MSTNHDEKLPLGIVPVLALGDAWLGDIDAHLTCIEGMNQLCKRATVIHIHLQWESNFLLGQVAQICAIQLLSKAVFRNLRYHQRLRLLSETLQELERPYSELMAVALKKCGVIDAKTYYQYFKAAEEMGLLHKVQNPTTNVTWVEAGERIF